MPSSMPAAAAVRAYMVKLEGSMLVEAANMPLVMHRKSRKQCASAGRYRRATALPRGCMGGRAGA